MRSAFVVCLLGAASLSSGCNLFQATGYNLAFEFSRRQTDVHDSICLLADCAWEDVRQEDPEQEYTADHALGFKDGFADYLSAGGTGHPPPIAPRRYWAVEYKTAAGQAMIEQWYAGYRHGADVARESGYRRLVTLPASAPLPGMMQAPGGGMPGQPVTAPGKPNDEVLPPPKKLSTAPAPGQPVSVWRNPAREPVTAVTLSVE